MKIISMSQQELDKYSVLKRVNRGEINGSEAAKLLNLTPRHIRRLKKRIKDGGAKALTHASRGKSGNRKIPDEERKKIVKLLKEKYEDFKPTFATEKLAHVHDIHRDPKTIRKIQIDEGLWKPKKKKNGSQHRAWRQRRSCYGEMEQFDGSYEAWLEDRLLDESGLPQKICLLASIDDAMSHVTHGVFAPHEGVIPVFSFWDEYLKEHGKPMTIYVDKFSTYSMNHKVAKENPDTLTQFERVAQELQIGLIRANSPQAKGRIERLFNTFQDRLIKEMRLAGISTVEGANAFLKTYLPKFNEQFGREPASKTNMHRQLSAKELNRLPSIFSRRETRVVNNDFTISHKNTWYQLTKNQPVTVCKKDKVTMEERLDDSLHIRLRGKSLNYEILHSRSKRSSKTVPWVLHATTKQPGAIQSFKKPTTDHPWRHQIRTEVKSLIHTK